MPGSGPTSGHVSLNIVLSVASLVSCPLVKALWEYKNEVLQKVELK